MECFARAAAPRPAVIRQHFRADKSIKIFMRPRDPTRAAPCTRSRHTWGAVGAGCEILQASQVLHKFCKLKCKCKGEGGDCRQVQVGAHGEYSGKHKSVCNKKVENMKFIN